MNKPEPLHALVAAYVRSHNGPLSPAEIADGLVHTQPSRFSSKLDGFAGNRAALVDQVTREIYGQWRQLVERYPDLSVDRSKSPLSFMVAELGADVATTSADDTDESSSPELKERELYEPLREFLSVERSMVSKRIREGTSSNRRGRNGNQWLHPDIVAMEPIGQRWLDEVRGGANLLQARRCRLVSLEVKLVITTGTLRQYFFQTASNSLWANEAYLCARDVVGPDTMDELVMLCDLHGVGLIQVDVATPSKSRFVIPARKRSEVDWASVNRIAGENADFKEFIGNVHNFLQTGRLLKALWA